ncbi:MAG: endonuclease domain-containing protein [Oscillospiraceae bacterium]|nr:endonuclease domain-containing protein [Oscillospiraceae bacterium]
MNGLHNPKLAENAKYLRKNMTKEERHLWYDFLKELPMMVHRQKVIGKYIVDFYIARQKIVIELDGSQHYEKEGQCADLVRDTYLKSLGMRILRYSNADINCRFEAVCRDIWNHLQDSDEPKPSP